VLGIGRKEVDLAAALEMLRTRYAMRLVLCEGGPVLTHDLIRLGLVDELFLTLAPLFGGDPQARRLIEGAAFSPNTLPRASLLHVLANDSELFLRYRLHFAPPPA
jgi:riboflavin biosynthesis pyrimidine reductase